MRTTGHLAGDLAKLLLLPPVVALLPWSVALARGRRGRAALLFVAWAAAWACAAWVWFGIGVVALVALGAVVVVTTVLEGSRARSRVPGP